jgi:hypothetical protein
MRKVLTTCPNYVSGLLLRGFVSTNVDMDPYGSISTHSTWQLLVSIHFHAIFPNVSWSVVVPNPDSEHGTASCGRFICNGTERCRRRIWCSCGSRSCTGCGSGHGCCRQCWCLGHVVKDLRVLRHKLSRITGLSKPDSLLISCSEPLPRQSRA